MGDTPAMLREMNVVEQRYRFCVIATVVPRATARAVCQAFVTAMVALRSFATVLAVLDWTDASPRRR